MWLVHPLPNDKILECAKLKAFADDVTNMAIWVIFITKRFENIVEKVTGIFSYSHIDFKRLRPVGYLKLVIGLNSFPPCPGGLWLVLTLYRPARVAHWWACRTDMTW